MNTRCERVTLYRGWSLGYIRGWLKYMRTIRAYQIINMDYSIEMQKAIRGFVYCTTMASLPKGSEQQQPAKKQIGQLQEVQVWNEILSCCCNEDPSSMEHQVKLAIDSLKLNAAAESEESSSSVIYVNIDGIEVNKDAVKTVLQMDEAAFIPLFGPIYDQMMVLFEKDNGTEEPLKT